MHSIFTQFKSSYASQIQSLGIKNQILISKSHDLGAYAITKELQKIDEYLIYLLRKGSGFDFVGEIANGKTLLVGEGNLSFTYSLIKKKRINPNNITASTFEKEGELSDEALANKEKLKGFDVLVLHYVNATKLSATFGAMKFDNIIFQFPHVGSREPIEGRNPNFILVRNFLKSAKHHLRNNGKVLITTVDSPHYHGAFQFDEAAEKAGFEPPVMYKFDPSDFSGYSHTMTNEDVSAIDDHKEFCTWVFRI